MNKKGYTIDEIINTLRYKAENIKAHIEPEFFNMVAACMEEFKELLEKKQQLTVYNVDKVVEKLEELKEEEFKEGIKEPLPSDAVPHLYASSCLHKAIKVVKAGGIDE